MSCNKAVKVFGLTEDYREAGYDRKFFSPGINRLIRLIDRKGLKLTMEGATLK